MTWGDVFYGGEISEIFEGYISGDDTVYDFDSGVESGVEVSFVIS